jgi:hypothetical protein
MSAFSKRAECFQMVCLTSIADLNRKNQSITGPSNSLCRLSSVAASVVGVGLIHAVRNCG